MAVREGISLRSFIKDAETVAAAGDLFNWKALRVHNPLDEASYIQYDNSCSTDGEQVAARFRKKLNTAGKIDVEREKARKLQHSAKPTKTEKLLQFLPRAALSKLVLMHWSSIQTLSLKSR